MANTRRTGGLLSISWDFSLATKMAAGIRADSRRADRPIREAHEESAKRLQNEIALKLEDAIKLRGRSQERDDLLLAAIESEKNREVNLTGFTVGYLDDIKKVRLYYRNLEAGTAIFVGTYLQGAFQDAEGQLSYPTPRGLRRGKNNSLRFGGQQRPNPEPGAGAVNGNRSTNTDPRFLQFAKTRSGRPAPSYRITHQIVGYHYIEDGYQAWRQRYTLLSIGLYREKFQEAGLDNLDRFLAPFGPAAADALLAEVTVRRRT